MTTRAAPGSPPRAAIGFIFVTVILDVMAGSMIGPVLPKLLRGLVRGDMARIGTVFGAMVSVFAVMQLFAGPVQGALSDRFGRRPIILAANFGLAADYVIMALAPSVGWLFVGRVVAGAAAGSITAAYAYVADVTPQEKLASRFGLLMAALSAGLALGSALGGFLGEANVRAPFWVAGGLSLANGVYGLFVLPESLPRESRAPLSWKSIHPIGAVGSIWRDYPLLKLWHAGLLIFSLANVGVNSIFSIYATYRFGWTPRSIGLYSLVIALAMMAVQGGLVGHASRLLGERVTLTCGLVLQTVAMAAAGLARDGVVFSAIVVTMIVGGVAGPLQGAMVFRIVGIGDRGRLSGAARSLGSLAAIAAPLMFAGIFSHSLGGGPHSARAGMVFYIAAAMMVAASIVTLWAARRSPPPT